MKKLSLALAFLLSLSTPTWASEDCSTVDAGLSLGVGAGVGAAAGVAAVWTLGILAAPFTLGGSLATSWSLTGPAIALGAKGGAFYGAGNEVVDCVQAGARYLGGK